MFCTAIRQSLFRQNVLKVNSLNEIYPSLKFNTFCTCIVHLISKQKSIIY